MKNNNDKQKEDILKVLRDFGRLPTARISAIVGINYNSIKILLAVLEEEGKIISEKAGYLATYWKINDKGIKLNGK